jgi:hypothetical protein
MKHGGTKKIIVRVFLISLSGRVARLFLIKHSKIGKNIADYQHNVTNGHKIYLAAVKYAKCI